MSGSIRIKRVYEPAAPEDGLRVLVDRLWPRGVRKADARVDHWLRDLAPSTELRRWFGHEPARWDGFKARYREELASVPEALESLLALCREDTVTLLFGARDETHNQAVVLRDVLVESLIAERSTKGAASPVCYGGEPSKG